MADRQAEILAWIGRKTLDGDLPEGESALEAALENAGFDADDIRSALRTGDQTVPLEPKPGVRGIKITQLTDDATRFLNALRALGYLDDDLEDEVLDRVVEEGVQPVTLDVVRRHVATVLFDRQYELDPDTLRLLEEEWRLVFH